jgi:peptide/nickel transport system permease protein
MLTYIGQRFLQFLLIIFIANSLTFLLPRMIPGDPIQEALTAKTAAAGRANVDIQKWAAEYSAKFGLDESLWQQYLNYWYDMIRLDFGYSLNDYPATVMSKILAAIPWTFGFMSVAIIIAFIVGSALGALLAWPNSPGWIHGTVPFLMIVSVVPLYLFGLALIWVFGIKWRLLPTGSAFDPTLILRWDWKTVANIIKHAILPASTLVMFGVGSWALRMRGTMVTILGEDYITFAQSKGLPDRDIFLRYGVRNALLPQVTELANFFGLVLGSGVLVESIFAYPGLGSLINTAINTKDYFVINGTVSIMVLTAASAMFIVDIIYPFIDPRIRYNK